MRYIKEFDPDWAADFSEIANFLAERLNGSALIHHVGSTSVPDMVAKDIVDVDIECACGAMGEVIERLAAAGYEHRGDQGIPTREAFRPVAGSAAAVLRAHHLYACEADSPELQRHLAFRDYLLAYPERARWLAAQKIQVDQDALSREAYITGKTACYEMVVAEAMDWLASG